MAVDDVVLTYGIYLVCVGLLASFVGVLGYWVTLSGRHHPRQHTAREATTVQRELTRREGDTDQSLRSRGVKRITVNVSSFLSEEGCINQEVAVLLKKLTLSYDVFFLALCTTVEVREQIRRAFHLEDILSPWQDRQHRVIFVSTGKGMASAVRQLEPDLHVSQLHEIPRC